MTKLRSAVFVDYGWLNHGWTKRVCAVPRYMPSNQRRWWRLWIVLSAFTLRVYVDTDFDGRPL